MRGAQGTWSLTQGFDVETWGTGNDGRDVCSCLLFLFYLIFGSPREKGYSRIRSTQHTAHSTPHENEWNGNGSENERD